MAYDWITFTTDYGLSDGFVAACHGVIARIAPDVRLIDITHAVNPHQIRPGCTVLAQTVPFLPEAVHLAVVDPGVGTSRRGIVVVTPRGLLVGPDNGLLMCAADALGGVTAAFELTNREYWLPVVSATFHGRDIFAPVAAHLALGVAPSEFGPPSTDLVRLPEPRVDVQPGRLTAEILTVDHFGNVQLAASLNDLEKADLDSTLYVHCGRKTLRVEVGETFADAATVLYSDSAGRLSIAVNGGSAAAVLDAVPSQECAITSSPSDA